MGFPKIVPADKVKHVKAEIKAMGCQNVAVKTGTDGSGTCSFTGEGLPGNMEAEVRGMKIDIDGVSTGCCSAVKSLALAAGNMNSAFKGDNAPPRQQQIARQ